MRHRSAWPLPLPAPQSAASTHAPSPCATGGATKSPLDTHSQSTARPLNVPFYTRPLAATLHATCPPFNNCLSLPLMNKHKGSRSSKQLPSLVQGWWAEHKIDAARVASTPPLLGNAGCRLPRPRHAAALKGGSKGGRRRSACRSRLYSTSCTVLLVLLCLTHMATSPVHEVSAARARFGTSQPHCGGKVFRGRGSGFDDLNWQARGLTTRTTQRHETGAAGGCAAGPRPLPCKAWAVPPSAVAILFGQKQAQPLGPPPLEPLCHMGRLGRPVPCTVCARRSFLWPAATAAQGPVAYATLLPPPLPSPALPSTPPPPPPRACMAPGAVRRPDSTTPPPHPRPARPQVPAPPPAGHGLPGQAQLCP